MFSRILIANRGEIALRIIRSARELGIQTVCVFSEADRGAPWLDYCDDAVCIGPPPASESYLNIPRIISAAEVANVDAIHPGYGFLAENAHFAEICRSCKIAFIGPSPESMSALGDKINCKKLARQSNVPVFPGSESAIEEKAEALQIAEEIGYPVIVKASAGGGGRGMRIAHNRVSLETGIDAAQAEAQAAFGNGAVYVEKFLETARHVEVQVMGDQHGNAVHLFDRDCSTQRRHQKLIEEAPAPGVDPDKRDKLCTAAARLIQSAGYSGAATVEFLMDDDQLFYMLEVNTRVQVEHPVTEMITGIDIVAAMIRVSAGEPLPFTQDEISIRGHAIECRINAEDPDHNFAPRPGTLSRFDVPGGPGVRVDTHCRQGYRIPPNYDSLIGKLIVAGRDREHAIQRTLGALTEFQIEGIPTTIGLHRRLLKYSGFINAEIDIHYLERLLA
ncbi:MAG: acetyl-CoA carboxylase biotin carboxylase subunit [Planctomycetes bacterium]|nr:acetyl-CoA carboxylase biotin carboxylase subunit [Planctomycetota bacterium]NOG54465.1 acetyl-CoA carboxylase biotin carboxylase subunit [Planctomycetota bacterium]